MTRRRKFIGYSIIGFLAILSLTLYSVSSQTSEKPSATLRTQERPHSSSSPVPCQPLVTELPPLYADLQWLSVQTIPIWFKTTVGKDILVQNGYHIESAPLRDKPENFVEYYKRELPARGWQKTDYGSIAAEEWHSYEHNGRYFSFGYYAALGVPGKATAGGFRALVEHN